MQKQNILNLLNKLGSKCCANTLKGVLHSKAKQIKTTTYVL